LHNALQNKRIEEVERELDSKEKMIFDLSMSIDNPRPSESPLQVDFIPPTISSDATDETKMVCYFIYISIEFCL